MRTGAVVFIALHIISVDVNEISEQLQIYTQVVNYEILRSIGIPKTKLKVLSLVPTPLFDRQQCSVWVGRKRSCRQEIETGSPTFAEPLVSPAHNLRSMDSLAHGMVSSQAAHSYSLVSEAWQAKIKGARDNGNLENVNLQK
jgi:hypothetical protein